MSGRTWTPFDIDRLEAWWGVRSVPAIAKQLDRTVYAVYLKAGQLHLGRERPPDVLTQNQVLQVLGVSQHHVVTKWIRDGRLKAERHVLNGQGRGEIWIRDADLQAFITEYEHFLDRDKVLPPYQRLVTQRWITLPEAFRRGAAWVTFLEHAALAGLLPYARKRGAKSTRWVIPEARLPELTEARRLMTDDAEHRKLVRQYDRLQHRGTMRLRRPNGDLVPAGTTMTPRARHATKVTIRDVA